MVRIGWRKGLLAAVVGLALLVLVIAGVGWTLPVAHTASGSARFDAPAEDVWRLVTEVERFPEWRASVTSVRRLPDRDSRPVWQERSADGALTFAVERWEPPRRLVARIIDEDLPFGGSWTYDVVPDGDGARLTITEDGEVYNPIYRFMARYVFGHEATLRDYLAEARAELDRRR